MNQDRRIKTTQVIFMKASDARALAFKAAKAEYDTVIAMVVAASNNAQLSFETPFISEGAHALLQQQGYELRPYRDLKGKTKYRLNFSPTTPTIEN